jgi:hypothetical protein
VKPDPYLAFSPLGARWISEPDDAVDGAVPAP